MLCDRVLREKDGGVGRVKRTSKLAGVARGERGEIDRAEGGCDGGGEIGHEAILDRCS